MEYVTEFNFLGLILDSNLNWKAHTNFISVKIARVIIYSKERKTAVTHTHNTEINYLYTRLLSYTNTFTQEKNT